MEIYGNSNEGKSKGYGFVKFYSASDAKIAMEELNGVEFMGKVLTVRLDDIGRSERKRGKDEK